MLVELSVLKELNPNEISHDDWPTIDLEDAFVWSPKSTHPNNLIDLLDVLEKGPFTVEGRIRDVPDGLRGFARNPSNVQTLKGKKIRVANVRRWSIERLADESIVIWALGGAAWYGIHPSDDYNDIYNIMVKKAAIYNFIIDKYDHLSIRSKHVKTPITDLYNELSVDNPVLGTPGEVEGLVHMHRRFIMAQLIENAKFKKTPFWPYFDRTYPGEIAEVQAAKLKAEQLIMDQDEKKAQRLESLLVAKGSNPPGRRRTRARSGTASSGTSEPGPNTKRKSRDHSTEEPDSRRRKTGTDESSVKPKIRVKLGQKSRRSNRIPGPSNSPTPETVPTPLQIASNGTVERVILRTTRSTRSSNPSSASPTLSNFGAVSASSISTAPTLLAQETKPAVSTPLIKQNSTEPPAPPKPSIDMLKEVIEHKPVVKTNVVRASKLSRLPGSRSSPRSKSPPAKKVTRSAAAASPQVHIPPLVPRATKRSRKRTAAPVPPVVPLDESHPGYDDLRDQAISKLTQMHSLYQQISKNTNQSEYEKFLELADENAEWRRQHGLKAVYIDVVYAAGYYKDEIKDSSLIRRVPGTEYLIDRAEWDFDTAAELLQNVNRGTYVRELLQPVKEAKRNARMRGGKHGRGRPRKHPVAEEVASSLSELKITSIPNGASDRSNATTAAAVDLTWKCKGHDADGNKCLFFLEDASTLEGAKKASDHWRTCELRKLATEETLVKKRENIEEAQTIARDQQVRDPWINIDHLVSWLEGEATKSKSWFPAGVC
ncbi:uncharacterized protein DFL_004790 [Arthrobotrys flagrans]|uniref:RFTS domain-containing protein n=1 Tax=Arthrobotrys flagrans TaxID=97331 RepID=A0A437A5W6_ARTFL|nr:hypothetical protein DFL_004790 [Arthrobotrys flagrans]